MITEDVTDFISRAGVNEVSYEGFYNAEPYSGDNWRGISMTAFVVVYGE